MKARQQGDVRCLQVPRLPKEIKLCQRTDRKVLAYGEVTNHRHLVVEDSCEVYEAKDGTLYLKVVEDTTIRHEEHHPITLTPGIWKVTRIREVDHVDEQIRSVQD